MSMNVAPALSFVERPYDQGREYYDGRAAPKLNTAFNHAFNRNTFQA